MQALRLPKSGPSSSSVAFIPTSVASARRPTSLQAGSHRRASVCVHLSVCGLPFTAPGCSAKAHMISAPGFPVLLDPVGKESVTVCLCAITSHHRQTSQSSDATFSDVSPTIMLSLHCRGTCHHMARCLGSLWKIKEMHQPGHQAQHSTHLHSASHTTRRDQKAASLPRHLGARSPGTAEISCANVLSNR